MRKEQIMIYTITFAIAVGAIFAWYYYNYKTVPGKHSSAVYTETETDKEQKIEIQTDEREASEVTYIPFEEATYVTVEKVVRTTTEGSNGNAETVYDKYLVSDVDLKNGTDHTEEFSKALNESEYDEGKIETANFSDTIGFSYDGLNGLEVHDKLLKSEGFDGNLSSTILDEATFKLTGQELYVLNEECTVLNKLIPKDAAVNILEKKAYCQVTKDKRGNVIPDYYVALVRFEQDGKTIEKSMYLQITINDWEEETDEEF